MGNNQNIKSQNAEEDVGSFLKDCPIQISLVLRTEYIYLRCQLWFLMFQMDNLYLALDFLSNMAQQIDIKAERKSDMIFIHAFLPFSL